MTTRTVLRFNGHRVREIDGRGVVRFLQEQPVPWRYRHPVAAYRLAVAVSWLAVVLISWMVFAEWLS